MKRNVVLDTGPLVAFLNRRDTHHSWARDVLSSIEPPLHTCEAVLSEACFLLRKLKGGQEAVFEMVSREILQVSFHLDAQLPGVRTLVKRYASVPASLADACIIRMVEMMPQAEVMTLDSDFSIYRLNGRNVIPVITPESV